MRNEYWHQRSTEVSSINGIQPEWDSMLHLLQAPGGLQILTFSPDGVLLAAVFVEGDVVIWDSISGIVITEIDAYDWIEAAVFSPDSTTLACLTVSGTMQFWDAHSGLLKSSLSCCPNLLMPLNSVRAAKFSITQSIQFPDDGRAWDVVKWQATHIVPRLEREGMMEVQSGYMDRGQDPEAWFQVFSEDGMLVASPNVDDCIMLWNTHTGKLKAKLQGHKYAVDALIISPDLSTIISSGSLSIKATTWTEAYLWNIDSGKKSTDLNQWSNIDFRWRGHMRYTKDSKSIVYERFDGLGLLNIECTQITHKIPDVLSRGLQAMSSKEDRIAYSVGEGVRISLLRWIEDDGTKRGDGHGTQPGEFYYMKISSRGLIALRGDEALEFRDISTNEMLAEYTMDRGLVSTTVIFSDNGQRVMHTEGEGTIVVRETSHFSQLFTSTLHGAPNGMGLGVLGTAFSPDGRLLAFSSRQLPFTIWDIESGMILACLEDVENHIQSCMFHPHANEVICALQVTFDCPEHWLGWSTKDSIVYFEIQGGFMLPRWHLANYRFQCFVSDGSRLVAYPVHDDTSTAAMDILCVKTGSRLIRVADGNPGRIWWSPVTDEMLPKDACRYIQSRGQYMDVETGEIADEPPVILDPEIRHKNGWVLCNGKRVVYIPHAFRTDQFSLQQWKERALFIGKYRYVQLSICTLDGK